MGDYRSYMSSSDTPKLALLAGILDASGLEPNTLAEALEILDREGEAERFEEILEIGSREKQGHRYKLGLRVPRKPSEDGLLAVRVFEGYPFAKAGVLEGDRILMFAHREIHKLRDIWLPLIEFEPGEDIPIRISRDGEPIDLTLIVE